MTSSGGHRDFSAVKPIISPTFSFALRSLAWLANARAQSSKMQTGDANLHTFAADETPPRRKSFGDSSSFCGTKINARTENSNPKRLRYTDAGAARNL
jgi:hypothetical protein